MHIQCILPHLDYCCVIWGNCSRSLEEKIVRFQKRAGRLILNKDFYLAVSCLRALRNVSGLKSSDKSKESFNNEPLVALSTHVCTAAARDTNPRKYWTGSSGPSHLDCQLRGV